MNATTKRHRESARRLLLTDIIEMLEMISLGATPSRASMHEGHNGATLREIPATVRATPNPTPRSMRRARLGSP